MRFNFWLAAVAICSVLAGGVTTWYLFMPTVESRTRDVSDHAPEMTASDAFHEATQLLQSPPGELDKGSIETKIDVLRQLAIRRQTEHPAELPAAWLEFQQLLEASTRSSPGTAGTNRTQDQLSSGLALLMSYEDNVETAGQACEFQADFETVWQVRDQVVAKIEARRGELLKLVQSRLDEYNAKSKGEDPFKALDDFVKLKQELERSLLTLIATSKTDSTGKDLEQVWLTAANLQECAAAKVRELRGESKQYAANLHDGATAVEPAAPSEPKDERPGTNTGECEQRIAQLQSLDVALDRADLTSWLMIQDRLQREPGVKDDSNRPEANTVAAVVDPKKAASTGTDDLVRTMSEAELEVRRLQQLAYNLWALREIEAAEAVDNWDHRLSRIDVGLLHATVAPLYSSTYGRRIEEIEEPQDRLLKVQGLLTRQKIGLESF